VKKLNLILALIFLSLDVSALDAGINLYKAVYSPGETLQAEVNFSKSVEVFSSGNVKLECVNGAEVIAPSIFNIDFNQYFVYFNIDKNVEWGNCSLILKNIIYSDGGILNSIDFNRSFILNNSNNSLSLSPAGARIYDINSQNNLQVYLTNNGLETMDIALSSSASFVDLSEDNLLIPAGHSSQFNIYISPLLIQDTDVENVYLSFSNNSLRMPIWLFYSSENITFNNSLKNNSLIDEAKVDFLMDVDNITISLNSSKEISGYVQIINNGKNLDSVSFGLSGNLVEIVVLGSSNISSFNSGDNFKEYLYINQRKNAAPGLYSGNLIVNYETQQKTFPINVEIIGEINIPVNNSTFNRTNSSTRNDESKISVWIYVGIFFIVLIIFVYILYKKRTKNLQKKNFPVR